MTITYAIIDSPIGHLLLASTPQGICRLDFLGKHSLKAGQEMVDFAAKHLAGVFPKEEIQQAPEGPWLKETTQALETYFKTGSPLPDVPLDPRSGTSFQRSVWEELKKIPSGQTRTYGEIAHAVGRPKAPRAVGQACGQNPIAIIVPCHRVVGGNGKLTGFGGGIDTKRQLLKLEGVE